ncbi:MAG TPA: nuclear transport factor 2 family protein [Polyangiaceae bacterium]|nr:nuclear transport factor 2 family protein [Polyangiaceae bacterium]
MSPTRRAVAFDRFAVLATRQDGAVSDLHVYFDVASVEAELGRSASDPHAASSAASPAGPPQVAWQSGSSDEMHNAAVVCRWLDAVDSIDRAAYLACLSEDVELTTPQSPQPARGKEAAAKGFEAIHRQLAELETRIDAVWAIGDFVAVEYSITGEQTAPIGWVPLARDRVVRLQVADVAELHDGRITRVWRYLNLAQANAPGP